MWDNKELKIYKIEVPERESEKNEKIIAKIVLNLSNYKLKIQKSQQIPNRKREE